MNNTCQIEHSIAPCSRAVFFLAACLSLLLLDYTISTAQEISGSKAGRTFEKIQLSETFYAEGAGIGDINQDGHADVVAGPYWYAGPDFKQKKQIYEPKTFDPRNYSDNFIIRLQDLNGDGRKDILKIGFPGEAAYWYENSTGGDQYWNRHLIHRDVDNEAPRFYDINSDGFLELVFHHNGYLGFAIQSQKNPTRPWSFNKISKQHEWGRFKHGLGVGDINGDGHDDIMMAEGWWENPGSQEQNMPWKYHEVDFGSGGAQMFVYDVDGDGLNDVLTTLDAHGWGLAWYEQSRDNSNTAFQRHTIMGDSLNDNPYGVRFSQLHALALSDVDNDGVKDLITGKRFWAHGPFGDFEPNAPAVVYWFKLNRDKEGQVSFVPYLVDDDSGVGVEIASGDITANGYPDIVTSNKNGTFVFLNQ